MLATDKQISYLQFLADKVERIKQETGNPAITCPHINWQEERTKGVTTTDASMRIDAYKCIIRACNVRQVLFNRKQY